VPTRRPSAACLLFSLELLSSEWQSIATRAVASWIAANRNCTISYNSLTVCRDIKRLSQHERNNSHVWLPIGRLSFSGEMYTL